MLSVEEIKAIIWRFVDEPWNKGDFRVVDEFCASDYTVGELHGTEFGDREFFKKTVAEYRAASPDFHAEVDEIIVEGKRAAYSWAMQYTLKGELKKMHGITILHFANGKIVKDRFLYVEVKPE